jgi:cell division protein FtsL
MHSHVEKVAGKRLQMSAPTAAQTQVLDPSAAIPAEDGKE